MKMNSLDQTKWLLATYKRYLCAINMIYSAPKDPTGKDMTGDLLRLALAFVVTLLLICLTSLLAKRLALADLPS